MVKRLFDLIVCLGALLLLSPLLIIVAVGIRLSSPGPVLYRAKRAGLRGKPFTMYKFRTMRMDQGTHASAITALDDPRVFAFGEWLRRSKIDELPQLWNILKGEMSIVGPRPEDPRIVEKYYAKPHMETLRVLPGLTSPGSICYYTLGEQQLDSDDPEKQYVERLLPLKLAIDLVYVREMSFLYDLNIIFRTVWVILLRLVGRRTFAYPQEMTRASSLIHPTRIPYCAVPD